MAGKAQPTARDRQVGARLRVLRDESGFTLARLAQTSGLSEATLSRMETGKRAVTREEVAMVTTALKVPIAERERLMDFVVTGDSGGWWDQPLPGIPAEMGLLASYEAEANELVDFALFIVPGLLQIEEYARAVWTTCGFSMDDADMRWVARARRQRILGRVDYTAFIHEEAIRTPFGGPRTLRAQVKHLIEVRDRGVDVRLVRGRQPNGALLHSWHYMGFPSVTPILNVEVYDGGFYLQDDRVEPYTRQLEMLDELATSRSETGAMLKAVLKEVS
ncbi:hypothetical protein BLA60_10800 [Actinophytocola xinjiangensis]|uniref:HTH cro/C1-type domain-containing protein n=1 Tax=Actinophytocola xinjiangensis TaxID=485602 RepID=A0A7Z0WPZ5_9PSEU|nr:helix-turn-helix transcriptional regulator [Actinophytocola xinjiangensis]OLF11456.1 hypothetical protein BLA60_10800 [Actinophytocola xinjiangensis]